MTTRPHTPPHPLQASRIDELGASTPSNRSNSYEQSSPITPPPSPASSRSSSPGPFDYMDRASPLSVDPSETSRWDELLLRFSQGRAMGRRVEDYIPFTAIAPRYLPPDIRTPAWILDQIRGNIPSDMIKLGPGSAISLQDIALSEVFYAPAAPTIFGTINHMQWHEDGYQITTLSMHVYSPNGYDAEHGQFCFIAIPIQFVDPTFRISELACNMLSQTSVGEDQVIPPQRIWEATVSGLRVFEARSILMEERSEAVRNWVDEQAQLGWF